MDSKSYYKYNETRARAGYACAWGVKLQNDEKYTLLVASESVPSVFGSQDSFEFDLLNSPTKGKVAGKVTLDDKEVQILHTRDNVYRLNKFIGKVLDLVYIDGSMGGYKYTGTISYRVNDAEADVARGTITISPMSADENYWFDLRNELLEPLYFAEVIPETVKQGDKINATVVQSAASVTYKYYTVAANGEVTEITSGSEPFTNANGILTVAASATTGKVYAIEASATGYASWATTVYVEA